MLTNSDCFQITKAMEINNATIREANKTAINLKMLNIIVESDYPMTTKSITG